MVGLDLSEQSPWVRGDLAITRSALAAIHAECRAAYARDEEACGYMRGPATRAELCDEAVVMENTANKLHALDPVTYFRTARTFFSFNEKKFDDAVRRSMREGRPVKVMWHSHLDAGAYFSPTDAAVMSFGEPPEREGGTAKMGPGPQWPLAFMVVSVVRGTVDDTRLFVWDASAGAFVPSTFTIVSE